MLDAMSIKQQVIFDSRTQSFSGFVNLGVVEDGATEAKEALVFMLVGLREKWKAPIAYYLTKGLPAEAQTELVKHALGKLHQLGFMVHALVMDGHASNKGMCRLLGCQVDPGRPGFKTYFEDESTGSKTHILFDACHMLKLVRNMLEAYSEVMSPTGMVKWRFIPELNEIQENVGLRLGNRLKKEHVNFFSQKMKVGDSIEIPNILCSVPDVFGIDDMRYRRHIYKHYFDS